MPSLPVFPPFSYFYTLLSSLFFSSYLTKSIFLPHLLFISLYSQFLVSSMCSMYQTHLSIQINVVHVHINVKSNGLKSAGLSESPPTWKQTVF